MMMMIEVGTGFALGAEGVEVGGGRGDEGEGERGVESDMGGLLLGRREEGGRENKTKNG